LRPVSTPARLRCHRSSPLAGASSREVDQPRQRRAISPVPGPERTASPIARIGSGVGIGRRCNGEQRPDRQSPFHVSPPAAPRRARPRDGS
jgi:hypothetical protein